MAEPLLILGASARAAVWSARRAGLSPLAIDLFGDQDLRDLAPVEVARHYPRDLFRLADRFPTAAWIYTGGLENYPASIDRLAARRPLLGNAGAVLRAVRNPNRLAQVCRAADFYVPPIEIDAANLPTDGSWLSKSSRASGGSHVVRWHGSTSDSTRLRGRYFQPYQPGLPCSAVFVAAGVEARLIGTSRQLIGPAWNAPHEFQYAGLIAPWPMTPQLMGRLAELGRVLVEEFGLCGLFGVDFLLRDQEIVSLEVNPRYTASVEVLERAMPDWSALADHVCVCAQRPLPLDPPRAEPSRVAGKAILFARRDLILRERLTTSHITSADVDSELPALADIPCVGTRIAQGQPVATVLASAADVESLQEQLRSRLARLEAALSTAAV